MFLGYLSYKLYELIQLLGGIHRLVRNTHARVTRRIATKCPRYSELTFIYGPASLSQNHSEPHRLEIIRPTFMLQNFNKENI